MTDDKRARWLIPALATILYLAQGFPYGLVTDLLPVYLRVSGWSRTEIGFVQTIALAWVWKFFWSPAIDAFGSYRRWMAAMLVIMTIAIAGLAIVPVSAKLIVWTLIAIIALTSATQDIAIDAMTIRITPQNLLGIVNSVRVAAYRGAFILAGNLALLTPFVGWRGAFFTGAAATAVFLAFTSFLPRETGESVHRESPFAGLARWMTRPRAALLLLIAFLYRVGENALTPMAKIFWVDRGLTPAEVQAATTTLGITVLVIGAFAGGAFIARYGIYRALLWFGVAQVLSNAGYALIATTGGGRSELYGVMILENFTGGLGTAAFLAFLMAICEREHAATQYAMLTALFALSRSLIGTASGWGVDNLGYATYFWITVGLGVPGLLLVPLVRHDVIPSEVEG